VKNPKKSLKTPKKCKNEKLKNPPLIFKVKNLVKKRKKVKFGEKNDKKKYFEYWGKVFKSVKKEGKNGQNSKMGKIGQKWLKNGQNRSKL